MSVANENDRLRLLRRRRQLYIVCSSTLNNLENRLNVIACLATDRKITFLACKPKAESSLWFSPIHNEPCLINFILRIGCEELIQAVELPALTPIIGECLAKLPFLR